MKKKFFSMLIAFLAIFGMATIATAQDLPILTSTAEDPIYYQIKLGRSEHYVQVGEVGALATLATSSAKTDAAQLFFFVGDNSTGIKMFSKASPTAALTYNGSRVALATEDQTPWFIDDITGANGVFGISSDSDFANKRSNQIFWNQFGGASGTEIGYWQSSNNDAGSAWTFLSEDPKAQKQFSKITLKYLLASSADAKTAIDGNEGTIVGQYVEGSADAAEAAIVSAQAVYDNADATKEEYDAAVTSLKAALSPAIVMPKAEQYFQILQADTAGFWSDGGIKAMYDNNGTLAWGNLQPTNASFMWEFVPNENGTYTWKNLGTGKYVGGIAQSTNVAMGDAATNFTLSLRSPGHWNIQSDPANTYTNAHCGGHSNGAGASGNVVGWDGGAGVSQWMLSEYIISNQMVLDAIAIAEKAMYDSQEEGDQTFNQLPGSKQTLLDAIYEAKKIAEGPKLLMDGYMAAASTLSDAVTAFQDAIVKPTLFEPLNGSSYRLKRASDSAYFNKFGNYAGYWKEHMMTFDPVGTIQEFPADAFQRLGTYTAKETNLIVVKSADGKYRLKYVGVENDAQYNVLYARLSNGEGAYLGKNENDGQALIANFYQTTYGTVRIQMNAGGYARTTGGLNDLYTTCNADPMSFDWIFEPANTKLPADNAFAAAKNLYDNSVAGTETFQYDESARNALATLINTYTPILAQPEDIVTNDYLEIAAQLDAATKALAAARVEPELVTFTDGDIYTIRRASDGKALNKSGQQDWKEHYVSFENMGKFIQFNGTSSDFPTGNVLVAPTAFKVEAGNVDYTRFLEMSTGYVFRTTGYLKPADSYNSADAAFAVTKNTAGLYRLGEGASTTGNYAVAGTGDFLSSTSGEQGGYDFVITPIATTLAEFIAIATTNAETATTDAQIAGQEAFKAAIAKAQEATAEGTSQETMYDALIALFGAQNTYSNLANTVNKGEYSFSDPRNGIFNWYVIENYKKEFLTVAPDSSLIAAPAGRKNLPNQLFMFAGKVGDTRILCNNRLVIAEEGDNFIACDTFEHSAVFVNFKNIEGGYSIVSKSGKTLILGDTAKINVIQMTPEMIMNAIISEAEEALNSTLEGVTDGTFLRSSRQTLTDAIAEAKAARDNQIAKSNDFVQFAYKTLDAAIDTYYASEIDGIIYSTADAPVWYYIANQANDARYNKFLTSVGSNQVTAADPKFAPGQMWRLEKTGDSIAIINRFTGFAIAIDADYANRSWAPVARQAAYAFDPNTLANPVVVKPWTVTEIGENLYTFVTEIGTEQYTLSLSADTIEVTAPTEGLSLPGFYAVQGAKPDASAAWVFVSAIQPDEEVVPFINDKLDSAIVAAKALLEVTAADSSYLDEPQATFQAQIAAADSFVAEKSLSDLAWNGWFKNITTFTTDFETAVASITRPVLEGILDATDELYTNTGVGKKAFQTPKASYKSSLLGKIRNAKAVRDIADDAEFASLVIIAINDLNEGVAKFKSSLNEPTEFAELIATAEAILKDHRNDVAAEKVEPFETAIAAAKEVLATASTTDEITAATSALNDAIAAFGYDAVAVGELAGVNVYTENGTIVVVGAEGTVTVTSSTGVVYTVDAETETRIEVAVGNYVVTANGAQYKVAVTK